jgi:hypothetical protein
VSLLAPLTFSTVVQLHDFEAGHPLFVADFPILASLGRNLDARRARFFAGQSFYFLGR